MFLPYYITLVFYCARCLQGIAACRILDRRCQANCGEATVGELRGGIQEAQLEHLPNETGRDKNVQLPVIISLIKIILVNNIPGGQRGN